MLDTQNCLIFGAYPSQEGIVLATHASTYDSGLAMRDFLVKSPQPVFRTEDISLELLAKINQLAADLSYLLPQSGNFIFQSVDAFDLRRTTNWV